MSAVPIQVMNDLATCKEQIQYVLKSLNAIEEKVATFVDRIEKLEKQIKVDDRPPLVIPPMPKCMRELGYKTPMEKQRMREKEEMRKILAKEKREEERDARRLAKKQGVTA